MESRGLECFLCNSSPGLDDLRVGNLSARYNTCIKCIFLYITFKIIDFSFKEDFKTQYKIVIGCAQYYQLTLHWSEVKKDE